MSLPLITGIAAIFVIVPICTTVVACLIVSGRIGDESDYRD